MYTYIKSKHLDTKYLHIPLQLLTIYIAPRSRFGHKLQRLQFGLCEPIEFLWFSIGLWINQNIDDTRLVGDRERLL